MILRFRRQTHELPIHVPDVYQLHTRSVDESGYVNLHNNRYSVPSRLLDGEPASPGSDLYSLTSALFTLFSGLPAYVRPGDQSIIPVIKRAEGRPAFEKQGATSPFAPPSPVRPRRRSP